MEMIGRIETAPVAEVTRGPHPRSLAGESRRWPLDIGGVRADHRERWRDRLAAPLPRPLPGARSGTRWPPGSARPRSWSVSCASCAWGTGVSGSTRSTPGATPTARRCRTRPGTGSSGRWSRASDRARPRPRCAWHPRWPGSSACRSPRGPSRRLRAGAAPGWRRWSSLPAPGRSNGPTRLASTPWRSWSRWWARASRCAAPSRGAGVAGRPGSSSRSPARSSIR